MREVTICSIGDLMISDSPLYVGIGVGSVYSKIKNQLFQNCKPTFLKSDVVIGNFETVIHNPRKKNLKELQMSCKKEVVEELRKAGFSILNLANNHSMQHGEKGFRMTYESCAKEGIHGIGRKNEGPWITSINGIKMAFFSLCIHIEWYHPQNILYENSIQFVINQIQTLKREDEKIIIILSVHWGDEFATYPSNAQVLLAHKFSEIGVDIILGHHSHVFQGIEKYKGSLIVYGQGNFVSDMKPIICRQTGVVKIKITQDGIEKLIDYKFLPYFINDDYIPIPYDEGWFDKRQSELEKVINGEISDDEYWKNISVNHNIAHQEFSTLFINRFFDYKFIISSKMIWDFFVRKIKKITKLSKPGRSGSMDTIIIESLRELNLL